MAPKGKPTCVKDEKKQSNKRTKEYNQDFFLKNFGSIYIDWLVFLLKSSGKNICQCKVQLQYFHIIVPYI
jgi:hypothetical protein